MLSLLALSLTLVQECVSKSKSVLKPCFSKKMLRGHDSPDHNIRVKVMVFELSHEIQEIVAYIYKYFWELL